MGFGLFVQYYLVNSIQRMTLALWIPNYSCNFQQSDPN